MAAATATTTAPAKVLHKQKCAQIFKEYAPIQRSCRFSAVAASVPLHLRGLSWGDWGLALQQQKRQRLQLICAGAALNAAAPCEGDVDVGEDAVTPRLYHISTMGCQMNLADSERMEGILCANGYTPARSPDEASLFILNTCSIRDKSEQKVRPSLVFANV